MHFTLLTTVAALVATVSAHGNIISQAIREPGPAFKELCGDNAFNLLTADLTRSHQNLINTAPYDPTYDATKGCNFLLCKGIPFDDVNTIYKLRPKQAIPVEYIITIPHPGYANLSVVDTTLNAPIGEPLKVFEVFGEGKDEAELKWSFEMADTGKACSEAGRCVLQFWWHSEQASQTYSSCIDFLQ
ncbi:hypothetical protein DFH27DRAFT_488011 [Peziza echinospora]|nr:hypothetical protein DFH27DRAFT_488011 [Peziza echinospora]